MNFKYSVIGDNSQENREWLEKVGYENWFDNVMGDLIYTPKQYRPDKAFYMTTHLEKIELMDSEVIDCRSNTSLFKAVSAIRDDSDYMQHFTDGRYWFRCSNYDKVELEFRNKENSAPWSDFPHKATLSELQERFKEK